MTWLATRVGLSIPLATLLATGVVYRFPLQLWCVRSEVSEWCWKHQFLSSSLQYLQPPPRQSIPLKPLYPAGQSPKLLIFHLEKSVFLRS